jgi:hypothetical protein
MFAIFENIESFNNWHEQLKLEMNFPIIGTNAATGEFDYENITTDYTKPLTINTDNRIVAWVGDENENLNLIDRTDAQFADWFYVSDFQPNL